jgi:hypothetical protein
MILDINHLGSLSATRTVCILAHNIRVSHPGQSRIKAQVRIVVLHIEEVIFGVHGLGHTNGLAQSRRVLLLELTTFTITGKSIILFRLEVEHIVTDFAELHYMYVLIFI